jgi:two-component system NtrC family response regulator
VDVRVVCATHQDLKGQLADRRFREDLYYRLAEIVVEIPALRLRHGDAMLLAQAFLRRFAAEQRRPGLAFTEDAMFSIERHPWPGNIRELLNTVRRAVIMAESNRLSAADLGLDQSPSEASPGDLDLRVVREQAERQAVQAALARSDGNVAKASELLGVSRPTLYDLMNRLAIRKIGDV